MSGDEFGHLITVV